MNNTDTRQAEYTELTARCGHQVYVRIEQDSSKAAEMILMFCQENCARRGCPATESRLPTRGICWSDVNR